MTFRPVSEKDEVKRTCNELVDALEINPGVGYAMANSGQYLIIILRRPPGT